MGAPILRRLRLGVYLFAILGLGYLVVRFDTLRLPGEGCSPVLAVDPGARVLVDTWASHVGDGSVVLFSDPRGGGTLLLGVVSAPPPSAPGDIWEAVEAGALWIVGDRQNCPGPDSRLLGPIAPDLVQGRVVLSWE